MISSVRETTRPFAYQYAMLTAVNTSNAARRLKYTVNAGIYIKACMMSKMTQSLLRSPDRNK